MNRISRHISYLLLTCRKVCVPGLGTFKASYQHASFNNDDSTFYPSRIRISFSSITDDNNILEKSLKRKLKIKNDEVSLLIEDYVREIKRILLKNHYCRIDGVGYLLFDQNNSLLLKDTFWHK